jgi:hypothetical protein
MKIILALSILATTTLAQEVCVRLSPEQYAAVQAIVSAENAAIAAANAETNAVPRAPIAAQDVLKRYADRLVQITSQQRKAAVTAKFEKATEDQKQKIEAEAAKVADRVEPVER